MCGGTKSTAERMFMVGRVELSKLSHRPRQFASLLRTRKMGQEFFHVMIVSSVVRDLTSHTLSMAVEACFSPVLNHRI